jgi:4-alpha-glucanotransferase
MPTQRIDLMKYGSIEHFQTGVALPVSGLRSNQNCGIGEYTDLIPLGKWCSTVNFDLIQILPINDTGEEPSPYSALSAFALNPAYIHLPKLPGFLSIKTKYDVFKNSQKNQPNVQYKECYRFKKASLHQMFSHVFTQVSEDKTFLEWIEKHRWVKPYGVYCFLKEQNQLKSWQEWETHKTPSAATINNLWKKIGKSACFLLGCNLKPKNN